MPEFNFVALNCMELRHPFDVYVKFWETMSGTRKETLPAPEAAYQLEEGPLKEHIPPPIKVPLTTDHGHIKSK